MLRHSHCPLTRRELPRPRGQVSGELAPRRRISSRSTFVEVAVSSHRSSSSNVVKMREWSRSGSVDSGPDFRLPLQLMLVIDYSLHLPLPALPSTKSATS